MTNHDISNPIFNKNLRKFETTDPGHADVFNAITSVLINNDVSLKGAVDDFNYKVATGTATTITVPMINLTDGYSKTFIASANNNAATTTINGKALYKPGTTTPPNLVKDKAYTVWYSQSKDCFFLKASAEGDAVAANVLAGKKFSNDNDTGLNGEMIDRGKDGDDYFNSSYPSLRINKGKYTQYGLLGTANPAPRLAVSPPTGYYPGYGSAYVTIEAAEVASAIGLASDKLISGTSVCGVEGSIPNKGQYQYTGGIGSGVDGNDGSKYVALNNIPSGYYPPSGNGWSPEIRVKMTDLANNLGITSDKLLAGTTICGVNGGIPINPGLIPGSNHIQSWAGVTVGKYSPDQQQRIYVRVGNSGKQCIDGDVWITQLAGDLFSENIVAGKNILGIAGNASIKSLGGVKYSVGSISATAGTSATIALGFVPKVIMFYDMANYTDYGTGRYRFAVYDSFKGINYAVYDTDGNSNPSADTNCITVNGTNATISLPTHSGVFWATLAYIAFGD